MVLCKQGPDRKNGFSWPTNILQILAIFVLISFTVVHFLLVVQYTSGAFLHTILTVSIMCCGMTVCSKVVCTLVDPADQGLKKDATSTYGKEKEEFDRAKQGHVITADSYCQICTTTVGLSSRHCSQCNKCVLRFDHHCDYINNCVGQLNYAYYISLLLSTSLYSLCVIVNIFYILYMLCFQLDEFLLERGWSKPMVFGYGVPSSALIGILVVLLCLAIVACGLVSNLSRLHVYLLYNGWTTWDYYCRPVTDRDLHSYWKYRRERARRRVEIPLSNIATVTTSSSPSALTTASTNNKKFCHNKTSPLPPHSL